MRYISPTNTAKRYDKTVRTIWRWSYDPRYARLGFPKPVPIGPNSRAFVEAELDEYDARRAALRDGKAA